MCALNYFFIVGQANHLHKEAMENRQNSEAAQRERYYATIHKVSALQAGEKIPGRLYYNICMHALATMQCE